MIYTVFPLSTQILIKYTGKERDLKCPYKEFSQTRLLCSIFREEFLVSCTAFCTRIQLATKIVFVFKIDLENPDYLNPSTYYNSSYIIHYYAIYL